MKKYLALISFIIISTFIGCGGSGENGIPGPNPNTTITATPTVSSISSTGPSPTLTPTPSPTPSSSTFSSDYLGLEPGFQLTYHATGTDYNGTPYDETFTQNTVSLGSGVFMFVFSDATNGGLTLKEGNNYYSYGHWSLESGYEINTPPYELILSIPLNSSSGTPRMGEVKGQETVTVAAGTYMAWLFEWIEDREGIEYNVHKTWIVPNIGMVKAEYSWTLYSGPNGVTQHYRTEELVSFNTGVFIQNPYLQNLIFKSSSTIKSKTISNRLWTRRF